MCETSGWNCTAYMPRDGSSIAAIGICSVDAVTRKPSGARVTASPCDIHTVSLVGQVLQQHAAAPPVEGQRRGSVLALTGRGDLAAERPGHQLMAVADAEHRHPEVEQPRIDLRRALGVDRRRSPAEDQPGGPASAHLVGRHVVRHDLGVDVRLAHAAGDQLRVLRAEVDDEDRARGVGADG